MVGIGSATQHCDATELRNDKIDVQGVYKYPYGDREPENNLLELMFRKKSRIHALRQHQQCRVLQRTVPYLVFQPLGGLSSLGSAV